MLATIGTFFKFRQVDGYIVKNIFTFFSYFRTRVAAGDAHGNLRMFQYPCTTSRAEFIEEKTNSTAIVAIRFLFEDMYIITVGGADATLLRWKII